MSAPKRPLRQWVSVRGGSFDLRLGTSVLDEAGTLLKAAVGRPLGCALVCDERVDTDVRELLRRNLTDQLFSVTVVVWDAAEGRTLAAAGRLCAELAGAGVTADDLVVAVGADDLLAVVSFVCGAWCGGVSLASVPVGEAALLRSTVMPRGLGAAGLDEALAVAPASKYVLFDTEACRSFAPGGEHPAPSHEARALMAATAMATSEKSFEMLYDAAADLLAGDAEVRDQLLSDTLRSRGQLVSSTSAAVRQSAGYGEAFARALVRVTCGAVDAGVALAEALRFSGRLAAGVGQLTMESVLFQDDLLKRLGLPFAARAVDERELCDALTRELLGRSRRMVMPLATALGRVRPTRVEAALLEEHVGAWCAAERELAESKE